MKRFFISIYFSAFLVFFANSQQLENVALRIDTEIKYQTIDHFGASDAWSIQFVGSWPESKRKQIADLLFSQDLKEGKPTGIGLSMWRMNLGAGTAAQGNDSGIKDEWRRAYSFLQSDGSLNRANVSGQLRFAEAAKERGVEKLLLFTNSPPVSLTKNGKGFSSDGKSNLAGEQEKAFASYVSKVFKELQKFSLKPSYFSPVNEPQWDWKDGGQEGNPYTNEEIASLVRAINSSFEKNEIEAKIDVAEAGKINYLFEIADKPNRGKQIEEFFDPSSSIYLGDLSHVSKAISGHSYFTTSPFEASNSVRAKLSEELERYPSLSYWMSEYCILGGNEGEINGGKRDLGMNAALYMARVIHQDLTVSNAAAWNWWLAVSPYDYKDGLIYIDKNKEDGNFYESKMLWALGNFSRFVRPGFERIEVETSVTNPEKFFVSGFQNPENREIILVLINPDSEAKNVTLENYSEGNTLVKGFLTSERSSLAPIEIDLKKFQLPSESILTLIIPSK